MYICLRDKSVINAEHCKYIASILAVYADD